MLDPDQSESPSCQNGYGCQIARRPEGQDARRQGRLGSRKNSQPPSFPALSTLRHAKLEGPFYVRPLIAGTEASSDWVYSCSGE
jgi:hypothetical protein